MVALKKCSSCRVEKPFEDFWKDIRRPDGRRTACISCGKQNYQKIKERSNKRCPDCDVQISPYRNFCRKHATKGARSGMFKSGREKDPKGYVILTGLQNVPGVRQGGQMAEHRYLMMQHLGRPLTPDETVHHKNGVKDDNRIENLELWSGNQPAGQRVKDLLVWAEEILERYAPDRDKL